jgi:hypothetical protein
MTDKEEVAKAIEAAQERGKVVWDAFLKKPVSERLNTMAQEVYVQTVVDWRGYPNGMPLWDELAELDHDDPSLSKANFRMAAWQVLVLAGVPIEELRDDARWEWMPAHDVSGDHREWKRLTLEGWEVVGPGLRRRKVVV